MRIVQRRVSVKISSIPAALVPSIIPVITDSCLFEVVSERSRVDEKLGDPRLGLCNFYRLDERQGEGGDWKLYAGLRNCYNPCSRVAELERDLCSFYGIDVQLTESDWKLNAVCSLRS